MSFISLAKKEMTLGAGGRVDSMCFPGAVLRDRMAQQAHEELGQAVHVATPVYDPAGAAAMRRRAVPRLPSASADPRARRVALEARYHVQKSVPPPIMQPGGDAFRPPPVVEPPLYEPPPPVYQRPPYPPIHRHIFVPPPEAEPMPERGVWPPPVYERPSILPGLPPKPHMPYLFPPGHEPPPGHRPEPHRVIPPPFVHRELPPPGQWPPGAHHVPLPMPIPHYPGELPTIDKPLPKPGPWPPGAQPVPIPMPIPVVPPEEMPRAALPTLEPAQAAARRSAAFTARARAREMPALPPGGMDPIEARKALEARYGFHRYLYPRIRKRGGSGYQQGMRREIRRRTITPRR